MAVEIGQQARLIQAVIQGTVVDTEYNKENKCLKHLVEFTDAEGDIHQRWFNESQLEPV